MADITVTAANVRRLNSSTDEVHQFIAGVTITAGQVVAQNSSGALVLADGSAAGTAMGKGVALNGGVAGDVIAVMKRGKVTGYTTNLPAYEGKVYISDTAGAFADAAGTKGASVGVVIASAEATVQKQLYVEFDWALLVS